MPWWRSRVRGPLSAPRSTGPGTSETHTAGWPSPVRRRPHKPVTRGFESRPRYESVARRSMAGRLPVKEVMGSSNLSVPAIRLKAPVVKRRSCRFTQPVVGVRESLRERLRPVAHPAERRFHAAEAAGSTPAGPTGKPGSQHEGRSAASSADGCQFDSGRACTGVPPVQAVNPIRNDRLLISLSAHPAHDIGPLVGQRPSFR